MVTSAHLALKSAITEKDLAKSVDQKVKKVLFWRRKLPFSSSEKCYFRRNICGSFPGPGSISREGECMMLPAPPLPVEIYTYTSQIDQYPRHQQVRTLSPGWPLIHEESRAHWVLHHEKQKNAEYFQGHLSLGLSKNINKLTYIIFVLDRSPNTNRGQE